MRPWLRHVGSKHDIFCCERTHESYVHLQKRPSSELIAIIKHLEASKATPRPLEITIGDRCSKHAVVCEGFDSQASMQILRSGPYHRGLRTVVAILWHSCPAPVGGLVVHNAPRGIGNPCHLRPQPPDRYEAYGVLAERCQPPLATLAEHNE